MKYVSKPLVPTTKSVAVMFAGLLTMIVVVGCKEDVVVGAINPDTACQMDTQATQNACEVKERREASRKRMKKHARIGSMFREAKPDQPDAQSELPQEK